MAARYGDARPGSLLILRLALSQQRIGALVLRVEVHVAACALWSGSS
jgi:hypothetical protein